MFGVARDLCPTCRQAVKLVLIEKLVPTPVDPKLCRHFCSKCENTCEPQPGICDECLENDSE